MNKILIIAVAAALCTIGMAIPPIVIGWARANGKFSKNGITVRAKTDITLWKLTTKISGAQSLQTITQDVHWSDLPDNDDPACSDGESSPTNADMHTRVKAAQAMAIITPIGTGFVLIIAALRLFNVIPRTVAVTAGAASTALAVLGGIGAIVAWETFYNGCSKNICDSFTDGLTLSMQQDGYATDASCGIYAGLPLVAVSMAGALGAMVCIAVAKDEPRTAPAAVAEHHQPFVTGTVVAGGHAAPENEMQKSTPYSPMTL